MTARRGEANPPVREWPTLLTRATMVLAALSILLLVIAPGVVILVMNVADFQGSAYPVDFTAFWGAAQLALDGRAIAAFDPDALKTAMDVPEAYPNFAFLWLYPPTYLAVIAPLGALPFSVAWLVFSGASALLFLLALRPHARALPGGLNLIVAAPVFIVGILNGNNGLLSAAILILALDALGRGDERKAGLLIALLTLKPQIGLLLPFVLAAGGHWRAIGWAAAGAVALALAATAIFGIGYWEVFFAEATGMGDRISDGTMTTAVSTTWYMLARALEAGHSTALPLQLGVFVAIAVLLVLIWRRRDIGFYFKSGLLLIAVALATPYAHYYELGMALAGLLILVGARPGWTGIGAMLFLGIWLTPALAIFVRELPLHTMIAAPLLTIAFIYGLTQVRRT